MASRAEVTSIYLAGIVQGLALVAFPAASTILTSPSQYDLPSTAYGALFIPQALMAIIASLSGPALMQRLGIKRVYLVGLVADFIAMALLFLSQFAMSNQPVAYVMLLLGTASLGLGFGLTVPALNTFTAAFFPQRTDSAILILNALLGLGTVLAPVFVAIFVGLGIWWGMPLLAAVLLALLLIYSARLPLHIELAAPSASGEKRPALPGRFWIFAGFALLYGIVETMNGNWSGLYMTQNMGATAAQASLALTFFWGAVTLGRLFFAGIARWFPNPRTYHVLPLVIAAAFVLLAALPAGDSTTALLAFALAGFGCSALLPLTISFGQTALAAWAASMAAYLIAFYQMGYGLAAFGVGPLQDSFGISLNTLYGAAAVIAVVLFVLSFSVTRVLPNRAASAAGG